MGGTGKLLPIVVGFVRDDIAFGKDHAQTKELSMQVIIIGGGISGLSLALSLHQVGIASRVYDAVPVLSPLGYGINLQPNAIRELTALGLGDQLAAAGILTRELAFYNK